MSAGCARDTYDLDLETKFTTPDVDYESDAPVAFSPELGGAIFDALTSMQADWGEVHPLSVRYSLLAGVTAVNPCGSDREVASACAQPGHVISYVPFHLHELAHVAAFARGSPPRAFAEGLAEIYGCTTTPLAPSRELTIEEIFDEATFADSGSYDGAAAFVSYLISLRGPEAFMRFYSAATENSRIDGAAIEHLGVSISEAHATWRASAPAPGRCRDVYLCDSAHPALASGEISLLRGLMVGLREGGAIRTLDLDSASTVSIDIVDSLFPRAAIVSCDDGERIDDERSEGRTLHVDALLAPGRYALILGAAIESASETGTVLDVELSVVAR